MFPKQISGRRRGVGVKGWRESGVFPLYACAMFLARVFRLGSFTSSDRRARYLQEVVGVTRLRPEDARHAWPQGPRRMLRTRNGIPASPPLSSSQQQ